MRPASLSICGLLLLSANAAAADHPFSRYRTISAPDCVDVSNMVAEYDDRAVAGTYMRVQHMGDPGTRELEGQIAQPVTWDAGGFTGLSVPPDSQRGSVDAVGYPVFQLRCGDAGFYIDTAMFPHASPLVGEGPNVTVARNFTPGLPVFQAGASLMLEADVRVPVVRPQHSPVVEGTAQVSFMLYLQDRTTGIVIAQLVGLLDDRPAGTGGSGVESVGSDGFTAFATSPLATIDGAGGAVRFVTVAAGSATMQYVDGWREARHFAAMITPANFSAVLSRLHETGLAASMNPSDYVATLFGLGGEVIAGTAHENEVALGASVANLALREVPVPSFIRR